MFAQKLVTLVAAVTVVSATVWAGTPKLVVPEPEFDFGEIENPGLIPITFVLKNEGDATLDITNIRPTCGCTVPDKDDMHIAPGESGTLNATVNLPGHLGPVHKGINITTNDPALQSFELRIVGSLLKYIYPDPQTIMFSKIGSTEVAEQKVIIKCMNAEDTFKVLDVTFASASATPSVEPDKSPAKWFKASFAKIPDEMAYEITVSTVPPLPETYIPAKVIVHTDSPKSPQVEIALTALPVGPIRVTPVNIMLPQPKAGMKPLTRNILVQPGSVDAIKVTGAHCDVEGVTVSVEDKGQLGFMVTVENIAVSTELEGKEVIIETNLPEKPEVRVPFQIIAPRAIPRLPAQ